MSFPDGHAGLSSLSSLSLLFFDVSEVTNLNLGATGNPPLGEACLGKSVEEQRTSKNKVHLKGDISFLRE